MQWAIFVHDPDGDMGDGAIVGPYRHGHMADKRSDEIMNESNYEAIVVPVISTRASIKKIIKSLNATGV